MQAIIITPDKKLKPTQVASPERHEGEIIIKVAAAALNRADLMQVDGNYPPPPNWPTWPGLEVSGTVSAVGKGSRFQVGEKVCALLGGGGYAEEVAVPEGLVLRLPKGLSWAEGAAIPEVYATAYLNFFMEGQIKDGDTIFLQAGASGLGLAAIQLLKSSVSCRIITTVGSDVKADFVKKTGADTVINYNREDVSEVLRKNPFDIALDCVGGRFVGENLEKMNFGGRWIIIAALGGGRTDIPLDILFRKRLRLIGSTLRSRSDAEKGRILSNLENILWPKLESGEVRPIIYRTYDWRSAEDAHGVLRRRENIGKVVLTFQ